MSERIWNTVRALVVAAVVGALLAVVGILMVGAHLVGGLWEWWKERHRA